MIHFVHPELLWLLALIPVRAIWKGKRGQAVAVRYSTASNARRLAGARKTRAGQWVYGFVIGALTVFLRTFSNFAEGIMFSVLLMNAFVLSACEAPAKQHNYSIFTFGTLIDIIDDSPVEHFDQPLRIGHHALVVGSDNERSLVMLVQVYEQLHQFVSRLRIQICCRFVGKHQRGLRNNGAGYGNALLLTAGHLGRSPVLEAFQSHLAQDVERRPASVVR